jgi:hypothetical protein
MARFWSASNKNQGMKRAFIAKIFEFIPVSMCWKILHLHNHWPGWFYNGICDRIYD